MHLPKKNYTTRQFFRTRFTFFMSARRRPVIIFLATVVTPPPLPGPSSPKNKVTIVVQNEIYHRENLVGPFLVHKLLGPRPSPPTPPLSSSPALSSPAQPPPEPQTYATGKEQCVSVGACLALLFGAPSRVYLCVWRTALFCFARGERGVVPHPPPPPDFCVSRSCGRLGRQMEGRDEGGPAPAGEGPLAKGQPECSVDHRGPAPLSCCHWPTQWTEGARGAMRREHSRQH